MASVASDSAKRVREQLARILATPDFANFPRSSAFLTYVVEQTLAGRAAGLKEAVIGVEVFGREPGYDAKSDSVVRTQARRVREKLNEYYNGAGKEDRIRIEIPKGAYVPDFAVLPDSPAKPAPSKLGWAIGAGLLLAAVAVGFATRHRADTHLTTLTVLPFADPSHRYDTLADGLTEDLERTLSRVPSLRLHAHPTGLTPEQRADFPALSRRLAVDALIDGRIAGDEIRVSLIRASDNSLLWTDRFPAAAPISPTERQIETAVASALGVKAPAPARHAENPQAHDLFFAGRALWATRDPGKTKQAIALYQEALKIDPEYALAYMGIADAYALMGGNDQIDSQTAIAQGIPAVQKALELDPSLAEAHAAYGMLECLERNFKACAAEYQRAIELNPSYDRAYVRAGTLQFMLGDFSAAERLIRESERLNPYAMSLPLIRAELYYYWRRFAQSEELADLVLKAEPSNATAYQILARDYLEQNQPQRAVEAERTIVAQAPERLLYLSELASYLSRAGEAVEAARIAERVLHPTTAERLDPLAIALMYARMRDKANTLRYLEEAQAEHSGDLPSIRFDPALDFVRQEPRYRAVAATALPATQ